MKVQKEKENKSPKKNWKRLMNVKKREKFLRKLWSKWTHSGFSGIRLIPKGHLISKADLRAIDSPKKRTDEFVLFAFFTLLSKQIKFVHMFFGRICGAPICFSVLSELY